MSDIIIPVLLSLLLGPGMGQFYNREYKKGGYLVGVSFLVLIGAVTWFLKAIRPELPPDLAGVNPDALQTIVRKAMNDVATGQSMTLGIYQFLLFALWIYGVIDAYRGGLRRHSEKAQPS